MSAFSSALWTSLCGSASRTDIRQYWDSVTSWHQTHRPGNSSGNANWLYFLVFFVGNAQYMLYTCLGKSIGSNSKEFEGGAQGLHTSQCGHTSFLAHSTPNFGRQGVFKFNLASLLEVCAWQQWIVVGLCFLMEGCGWGRFQLMVRFGSESYTTTNLRPPPPSRKIH